MSADLMTLAELIVINDSQLADIDATDILNDAPVLNALMATLATHGNTHQFVKESGAPSVGFRAVNAGRDHDHSEDTLVTATLNILDASYHVDKNLADIYKKGGAQGYLARESRRHLRAALFAFESQIFRGTTDGDSGGFSGFPDVDALSSTSDAMVIEPSTPATDDCSSVYMIRSVEENDCLVVIGEDGRIDLGEAFTQMMLDGSDKMFPAYVQEISGWAGLQIASAYSVARLCNLGTVTNSTLNDTLLGQLYDLFPSGRPPTHIVMTRRSRGQLRASRITDLVTAPETPTQWEGIPIITTDAISNDETCVLDDTTTTTTAA